MKKKINIDRLKNNLTILRECAMQVRYDLIKYFLFIYF